MFASQIFAMGGVNMQMVARGYLVYELTDSAKLLGLVAAGGALPVLVLSLFGGAVADRLPRKHLVQGGQVVSAAIAGLIAFAIFTDSVTWVYLLIAGMIQGSMWAFMMPARQAFIPQLVGKENVGNAVALSAAAMSATTLMAPVAAGIIYAVAGPDVVYVVISGLMLGALFLTSLISDKGRSDRARGSAVLADIRDGVSYVIHDSLVRVLLLLSLAFVLLAMPINFLMPVFVIEVYHRESQALGVLISMLGLGSLVGSLAVASLTRWRRGALIIGGGFVTGLALFLLAAIPIYVAAAAIMVLMGLGNAANRAVNQALVMEHVGDEYRGRVMSLYMMSFGVMPLGMLPMGFGADIIGPQKVVMIMAAGMIAITTVAMLTQRGLRSIQ